VRFTVFYFIITQEIPSIKDSLEKIYYLCKEIFRLLLQDNPCYLDNK